MRSMVEGAGARATRGCPLPVRERVAFGLGRRPGDRALDLEKRYGARPEKREIQKELPDPLAGKVLSNEVTRLRETHRGERPAALLPEARGGAGGGFGAAGKVRKPGR